MNSFRKWLYKPKKTDNTLLAQFYFADEELSLVAAELDSFDGRKDPERCTMLVNQLRVCQDRVLTVIQKIMDDAIPGQRANRDFRVKFPDDVLQDSLAGQLWFGAECLAAGSSILNREVESASMRPLARALTKNLESLRHVLRDQCLRSCTEYTERIKEALVIFDKLFAEFELSYVSAMVPVKTMKEYDLLQEVTVLFSETVQRALKESLLTQDMIDYCDPALMFTIPRLAIVCGLLIYPEGPLNPDMEPSNMTEMYRPFQTLLLKIRELLYTLSPKELAMLEKALCSSEEPEVSTPSVVGIQSETLLHIDQGFHEGGEGIVPLESISSNILVHSPGSGSPVTPVNQMPEGIDFGQLSPTSTIVDDYHNEQEIEDGFLNKSESQDSGLQSENVSTSDIVLPGGLPLVSHDQDVTPCTQSEDTVGMSSKCVKSDIDNDNSGFKNKKTEHVSDINSSKQSESDLICDKTDCCEHTECSIKSWINDQSCVKSDCSEDNASEVRHLCEDIVDDVVKNAVHCSDIASDKTPIQSDMTVCDNDVNDGDTSEVSDVTEDSDGQSNTVGAGVSRQFSWQYNVQFALPQLSLTDHDMADRQSSGSFSSDSTVSEDVGQPGSVSDFVIETLANMNMSSDSITPVPSDQTLTLYSSISPQRSTSLTHLKQLPSNAQAPSSAGKHRKHELHQSNLNKAQASNSHQSTLNKPNTDFAHKTKQGKRDSVENISCGIGAQAQPSTEDSLVGNKESKSKSKAVQTLQSEETASCSSSPSSVSSECDCDTQCSCLESETSSYNSETNDEEEIALAIQAAEIASRNEARSRFRSSSDLIHRLFVCIAGVADQLQTNYASDLRHILKCVFDLNTESLTEPVTELDQQKMQSENDDVVPPSEQNDGHEVINQIYDQTPPTTNETPPLNNQSQSNHAPSQSRVPSSPRRIFDKPPEWVPDDEVEKCTACKTPFTFVRRRHHCRNCGKIFCHKCSSTTVPLPHFGHQKPVRVCHKCFIYQVSHFTVSREF